MKRILGFLKLKKIPKKVLENSIKLVILIYK
jgi:hypothetical protein